MSMRGLARRASPERRAAARLPVTVPATLQVGEQRSAARLANIECAGAMLETSAPVLVGASAPFHCGTVSADATFVWTRTGRIGIRFVIPLAEAEVAVQLQRSRAVEARRGV